MAAANQEILGLSVVQTEFNNMGTTVVLALFRGDRVYVAGIGDSRAYRVRDGQIEQLTKDHSLAQALLEAGTITAEELPNHKFNHVLYLYLGSKDARGGPEDVRVAEVRPGDRFLLASDGLTGVVADAQLAEVVARSDDPQLDGPVADQAGPGQPFQGQRHLPGDPRRSDPVDGRAGSRARSVDLARASTTVVRWTVGSPAGRPGSSAIAAEG